MWRGTRSRRGVAGTPTGRPGRSSRCSSSAGRSAGRARRSGRSGCRRAPGCARRSRRRRSSWRGRARPARSRAAPRPAPSIRAAPGEAPGDAARPVQQLHSAVSATRRDSHQEPAPGARPVSVPGRRGLVDLVRLGLAGPLLALLAADVEVELDLVVLGVGVDPFDVFWASPGSLAWTPGISLGSERILPVRSPGSQSGSTRAAP